MRPPVTSSLKPVYRALPLPVWVGEHPEERAAVEDVVGRSAADDDSNGGNELPEVGISHVKNSRKTDALRERHAEFGRLSAKDVRCRAWLVGPLSAVVRRVGESDEVAARPF